MNEYSDNLSYSDMEAVLRALPNHPITGDEVAMILSEIAISFCDDALSAAAILGTAVGLVAATYNQSETLQ